MLKKFRKGEKGFTLIELLIVVAIIGILAAIAIPQFAAYRQKGFNSAAVSDIKNAKTGEESLFSDNQTYGVTENPATLAAALGVGGTGVPLTGANPPAGTVFALAGIKADTTVAVVPAAVSNGVQLVASTMVDIPNSGTSAFVLSTKHAQGTRVYAAEQSNTAVVFVENGGWAGEALSLPPVTGGALVGIPALAVPQTTLIIPGTTPGGGAPVGNWAAM